MSSEGETAISVQGLSKAYRIAHEQDTPSTLAETLLQKLRHPFRRATQETFWALRDVSFEIRRGEVVGIIGRNGAGKSTLLKILSRITDPTAGQIDLYGRVGSLLEVGTGFHPELTGRENIFLNGAILGMTKAEIRRQFDAIVDFSGVATFLDTPVKRYSSGMYVRLAFAVAAHLRSDILIIDEVLAVGDASFQKMCLDKMESMSVMGRTVVFVSHSMPTISRLCRSAILLQKGQIQYIGEVAQATRLYLSDGNRHPAEIRWPDEASAPGDENVRLHAVRVLENNGKVSVRHKITSPLYVEVEYLQLNNKTSKPLTVSIHVISEGGVTVFASNDFDNPDWYATPRRAGLVRARCSIPGDFLAAGNYTVLAAVCSYDPDIVHALEREAVAFEGVEDPELTGARSEFGGDWPGITRPKLRWDAGYVA